MIGRPRQALVLGLLVLILSSGCASPGRDSKQAQAGLQTDQPVVIEDYSNGSIEKPYVAAWAWDIMGEAHWAMEFSIPIDPTRSPSRLDLELVWNSTAFLNDELVIWRSGNPASFAGPSPLSATFPATTPPTGPEEFIMRFRNDPPSVGANEHIRIDYSVRYGDNAPQ